MKMLKSQTAGMATKSPSAVVIRASAMPVETAAIPPEPVRAIPRKALMMPMTVPKRPMKGAVVPIVASPESPFFMSAVVMSASRSLGRFDGIVAGEVRGACRQVVRELVEPGRYDTGQMAVLELLRRIDRLLQLILLQVRRHQRRELERLLLRLAVIDETLDRDRQGVDGHQDKQDAHTLGERRHRVPEIHRVKTH